MNKYGQNKIMKTDKLIRPTMKCPAASTRFPVSMARAGALSDRSGGRRRLAEAEDGEGRETAMLVAGRATLLLSFKKGNTSNKKLNYMSE